MYQVTQRVITAIWEGRVVYTSSSFLDILPGPSFRVQSSQCSCSCLSFADRWKVQETRLYSIKNAPILDHYRLRVRTLPVSLLARPPSYLPFFFAAKYRAILEQFTFLVLFFSFLSVVLNHRRRDPDLPVSALSSHELWFFVYALGYSLDKLASIMEHGWSVSLSFSSPRDETATDVASIRSTRPA